MSTTAIPPEPAAIPLRPQLAAWALAIYTSGVCADVTLEAVQVHAARESGTLWLDQASNTGSRTGVSHRELPASIEVIDAQTMQERGDSQIRDAVTRSTGLVDIGSGGTGGLSFSSRGFTGTNSVGIAEDGVRIQTGSGTQNYPSSAWGYDRVEVIRGPGSVVYGSGTVGATINAIRKEPSRVASLDTLFGLGSDGTMRIGLGGAGAVGEIGSYRIDAYGFQSDGFRDLGDSKGGKLLSKFRIQPSSDLRFDLTADYSLTHPERYWGTPYDENKQIVASLRERNYNTSDSVIRYEDTRLKAKADWKVVDWLSLSNETYHLESKRRWMNIEQYTLNSATNSVSRSQYLHIQHDLSQTGNRLEGVVKAGGHRWVAGWEAARVGFRHTNNAPYGGGSIVSASNPDAGSWFSQDPTAAKYDTTSSFNAFYAEDAWKVNDRWLLMAGIRKDFAKVTRDELISGSDFSTNLIGTSWRLGVTHHLSRDTSVYAQTSAGHDPVTSFISMNLANANFRLTHGKQAEIGVKQSLAQGQGEWTAALYRIEKDDIITRDPTNASLSVQGGRMHSQGIELTAAVVPLKSLRLEANYTRLTAKYDELNESAGGRSVSRAGNRPVDVPEQVGNLWMHYRLSDWQASFGLRYVGDRYADNANTFRLDPYTVADASLAWQLDKKTTLRFFVRNLSDKVYAARTTNTQFVLGEPRRFDLVAELRF